VARVKLVVQEPLVDLMSDVDQLGPVLVGEEPADTEVAGVVDGRFGSERAAFFEVLLDLRGAEVDLDRGLDAAVEDLGVKPSRRPAADAAAEDDRGLVGPTERELVGDRCLEPRAPGGRPVKDAGVGDLQCRNASACPYPRRRSSTVNGEGSAPCQRSKNKRTSSADRLWQIAANCSAFSQDANPLSSARNAMPC